MVESEKGFEFCIRFALEGNSPKNQGFLGTPESQNSLGSSQGWLLRNGVPGKSEDFLGCMGAVKPISTCP